MKLLLKNMIAWGCAGVLAIIIVSLFCFIYYRPVGWIERSHNATSAIWEPNTVIVNGIEGYGILHVDESGYTNMPNKKLAEDIVLCIGASFTQGKEVTEGQKYTDLLNEMLAEGDELKVYNLSRDAYFYPEIVSGLAAAVEEFPQTETVVIEIGNTDFSMDTLEKAFRQREFDEAQRGENLYEKMSVASKLQMTVKDYLPIYSVIKYQVSQLQGVNSVEDTTDYHSAEYTELIEKTLQVMRESFAGEIIILYHPSVKLNEQGNMELIYSQSFDSFKEICGQKDILLVDMGPDFMAAYEDEFIVPYGFSNTTIGEGHLNRAGHRLIGEKLFQVITQEEQ